MKNKEVYEQVRSKSESEIREKWQNFEAKASGKLGKTKILPSVFFII